MSVEADDYFIKLAAQYAEELIRYDEVERAVLILENIPAQFRDNTPDLIKILKKQITSSLCTPCVYLEDNRDSTVNPDHALDNMKSLLRGILMTREVNKMNEKGVHPHIVDMGPGDYFLPIGLSKQYLEFTYQPLSMNDSAKEIAKKHIASHLDLTPNIDKPKIFVANEVIEHLPEVKDIATNCLAFCGGAPEFIHLSTPLYTFDSRDKNWKKKGGLPHLRAYTPHEFYLEAMKMFQGYAWQLYQGPCMSLRGIRDDIEDKTPLITAKDYGP